MAESNYAKFQRQKREKAQAKRSAAAKRAAANKIINDLAKEGKKEKAGKGEDSPWFQLQKQQFELRKKKYEDQRNKESKKDKGEEDKRGARRALSSIGQGQRISSDEGGATASQKAFTNAAGDVGKLAKAAFLGARGALKTAKGKRDAASRPDKKEMGKGGRPRKPQAPTPPKPEMKQIGGTQVKGLLPPERRKNKIGRQLPPASSPDPTKKPTVGQPAAGSRPMLPGSMKRRMLPGAGESGPTRTAKGTIGTSRVGQPTPKRTALPMSVDKRKMLPPSSKTDGPARVAGGKSYGQLGQSARANPALRAKLTKERGGQTDFKKAKRKVLGLEEFSYKELLIIEKVEFLQEVDNKEDKKKKRKDVIDIMKGKNKVTLNPMEESKDYEGKMARNQLNTMERAIKSLRKKLGNDHEELPAWVQSKITKATDYIDTVADYMDSSDDISEGIDKSKMKCNKPKAQAVGNSLTGKSHVVKACANGKEKIIRFGQRGVKGSPKKKGESKEYASRRSRFKSRHAKNIAKGKMSAAYWANRVKW